jgi:hypothetical protein
MESMEQSVHEAVTRPARCKPKPRWGAGMIVMPGFGQTDDELAARGIKLDEPRGCRGFLHSDAQFEALIKHLAVRNLRNDAKLRRSLDHIRTAYLKGRRHEAAAVDQRDRNATLAVLARFAEAFSSALSSVRLPEDWVISGAPPTEGPGTFRMFLTFPKRLLEIAEIARRQPRSLTSNTRGVADLQRLSEAASCLAWALMSLDVVSQSEVRVHLRPTAGYELVSVLDIYVMTNRLAGAAESALKSGRRRRGPTKSLVLGGAVEQLAEVYETCGGRFTHTPRQKTHYDGRPHSQAGAFISEFFALCDPALSTVTISNVMAAVVRRRATTVYLRQRKPSDC